MNASLRTLLSGVVDYAGLFPPARLPLDQAIRNYARYRQEPDAWMLGRFVIPANQLGELTPYRDELFVAGPPFAFSVLGPTESWWAERQEKLVGTLESVLQFRREHRGRAVADAMELMIPIDAVKESDPRATARSFLELAALSDLPVYFEVAFSGGEGTLATVLEAIAIYNHDGPPLAGFKLRCGGLEASAFPTVGQVAFVLRACRDADVPLKFTAGLHHPLRRFDAGLQAHMHGFVNVFTAGVLAHARRLDEEALRAVIADEDAAHFRFTDDSLSWKDVHASTAEVADARRDFVTSFGSCSFDEPRDDLRALGWL